MTEQIVSFETAKLAKEKGFGESCYASYSTEDEDIINKNAEPIIHYAIDYNGNFTFEEDDIQAAINNGFSKTCLAPTQSLLQKWLREKHYLWIEITLWGDGIGTICLIKKANPSNTERDNSRIVTQEKSINTGLATFNYEETLEKGLQEGLKLIKMNIYELRLQIQSKFIEFDDILVDDNKIIVEQYYEMSEDEKNSDDCCDVARENGEMIIREFPMLEIFDYYCHRNKYAIVTLKFKSKDG